MRLALGVLLGDEFSYLTPDRSAPVRTLLFDGVRWLLTSDVERHMKMVWPWPNEIRRIFLISRISAGDINRHQKYIEDRIDAIRSGKI